MNKHNLCNIFLSLAAVIFLGSCTLSMEEWVKTEENKGYGEVEKVENDFMTFEYEYKPTTRSLTDKIQEYIVSVDEDSTVYFSDNIPKEWLPTVGGCLVSNCCERFPMGFICKVDAVESIPGMYRVKVSEAEVEDAYEEFNLDLDVDVLTYDDGEENTDTVAREINDPTIVTRSAVGGSSGRHRSQVFTRSVAGDDSKKERVRVDWRMYDMMKNGTKKPVTRAFDDDYKDQTEDIDRVEDKRTNTEIFKIELTDGVATKFLELSGGLFNQFSLGFYNSSVTHIHKIVELKTKRDYTDQTTLSGTKVEFTIGKDLLEPKPYKGMSSSEIQKEKEQRKLLFDLMIKDMFNKDREAFVLPLLRGEHPQDVKLLDKIKEGIVVEIPLGSAPVGILIRVKPTTSFSTSLYGTAAITWWSSNTHSITEFVNDEKRKDIQTKLPLPANEYDLSAGGKVSIGGGLEVFIGVGKRLSPTQGAGVGLFAEGKINFEAQLPISFFGDHLVQIGNNESFFSKNFTLTVGPKLLAGKLGDYGLATNSWEFAKKEYHFYPQAEWNDNMQYIEDEENGTRQYTIKYKFTDLGLHTSGFWVKANTPKLYIYKNAFGGTPYKVLSTDTKVSRLEANKEYTFTFKVPAQDYSSNFVVVPATESVQGETIMYTDFQRELTLEKHPIFTFFTTKNAYNRLDYIYQIYGAPLDPADHTMDAYIPAGTDRSRIKEYTFAFPFKIFNASSISNYWKDWGIRYRIGDNDETYESLKNNIKRSGTYYPTITFLSTNSSPRVVAEIYYVRMGESIRRPLDCSYDSNNSIYMKYPWGTNYKKNDTRRAYCLEGNIVLSPNYDNSDSYDWEIDGDPIPFTLSGK